MFLLCIGDLFLCCDYGIVVYSLATGQCACFPPSATTQAHLGGNRNIPCSSSSFALFDFCYIPRHYRQPENLPDHSG